MLGECETIFALSSGAPPSAIAIIRISGSKAGQAMTTLAGRLPEPRRAGLAMLKRPGDNRPLDNALLLWFPGPESATGEDLAEMHVHGGRAVVRAIEAALAELPGLRRAEPGEFTRRAFLNGRIDLAEAEGLADLLFAETEWQREAALAMAGGGLSDLVEQWRTQILTLSALVEADLDFSDEDDVGSPTQARLHDGLSGLTVEMQRVLARPPAERLRDGVRVVLSGPPNSGKSTLLNALVQRDAAIVSAIAGTTRDVIETPVALGGVPFVFVDTAGLRESGADSIEKIGIDRARSEIERADIVLWLGPEGEGPDGGWDIEAKSDSVSRETKVRPKLRLSAHSGENIRVLVDMLIDAAKNLLPRRGEVAVNRRQRVLIAQSLAALEDANQLSDQPQADLLLVGESLRAARAAIDALVGNSHTEAMLDALFGNFCIGK